MKQLWQYFSSFRLERVLVIADLYSQQSKENAKGDAGV